MTSARRFNFLPGKALALVALSVLLIVMLFPFVIVAINAIKSPVEYASNGPMSLPQGIYLQGLVDFWNRVDFTNKLVNSTVISLSVAILGVACRCSTPSRWASAGCAAGCGSWSSS